MRPAAIVLAAILFVAGISAPAHADVALSPLRLVLTKDTTSAEFTVSNPSNRILEGRVSWIDLEAMETGYGPAAPELRADLSAAPYLTVSPVFFRLEPGAKEKIVITIKDPSRLANGERRSHLLIETSASRTPIRKAGGGLELDLGAGISAPVIVRSGRGRAKAEIGATRLLRDHDGRLELETTIKPDGRFSPFGRLIARFTPATVNAAPIILGERRNVAGYLDAKKRTYTLPLSKEALPHGSLEIVYEGDAEFTGEVFARKSFAIAPEKPRD